MTVYMHAINVCYTMYFSHTDVQIHSGNPNPNPNPVMEVTPVITDKVFTPAIVLSPVSDRFEHVCRVCINVM